MTVNPCTTVGVASLCTTVGVASLCTTVGMYSLLGYTMVGMYSLLGYTMEVYRVSWWVYRGILVGVPGILVGIVASLPWWWVSLPTRPSWYPGGHTIPWYITQ